MYRSTGLIRWIAACLLTLLCMAAPLAEAAPRHAETKTVTIQSFKFNPQDLTINVGDTVSWTNKDTAAHTATASDKSFDSGKLDTDQSFSFTFSKAGSFSYVCAFHDRMTATIVVQEAGVAPAQPAPAQPAPASQAALEADNQPIANGGVTVKEVYADQDGWMVVHKDDNGNPGPVIGQTAVKKGETNNVVVKLSEAVPDGAKLWPMLHIDAGTIGTYEFPGADVPAKDAAGMVVMKQITVTASAAPANLPTTGADSSATIVLAVAAFALLLAGGFTFAVARRR